MGAKRKAASANSFACAVSKSYVELDEHDFLPLVIVAEIYWGLICARHSL